MLEFISWTQFLTAIATVLLTYYAVTTLLLYRTEILNHLNPPSNTPILGPTQPDFPTDTLEPDQLRFHNPTPDLTADSLLIGSLADLLEELKLIMLPESGLSPEQICNRCQALLAQHPTLHKTHLQEAVSMFLLAELRNLNLNIDLPTIRQWWSLHPNQPTK